MSKENYFNRSSILEKKAWNAVNSFSGISNKSFQKTHFFFELNTLTGGHHGIGLSIKHPNESRIISEKYSSISSIEL